MHKSFITTSLLNDVIFEQIFLKYMLIICDVWEVPNCILKECKFCFRKKICNTRLYIFRNYQRPARQIKGSRSYGVTIRLFRPTMVLSTESACVSVPAVCRFLLFSRFHFLTLFALNGFLGCRWCMKYLCKSLWQTMVILQYTYCCGFS